MATPMVPGTSTKLLTAASKMPCFSWSLPAHRSCPGAVYGEGTICGSCYAQKGRYAMPNVKLAQERRFDWTLACMVTAEGRDTYVQTMVDAIRWATRTVKYFRVHDSGDLFSPKYTECWRRIVAALPEVSFWFPTRMYQHEGKAVSLLTIAAIKQLATLPNATVRPSALTFGEAAPVVEGYSAGSGASKTDYNCPAHEQNNECRECRACWHSEGPIVYRMH